MRRRDVLGYLAALIAPGCVGSGDSTRVTPIPQPTLAEPLVSTPTPDGQRTTTATTIGGPNFEVVEWRLPDTVQLDEGFHIRVTIRNITERTRTYSGPMYFRTLESTWRSIGTWTGNDVPPGETVEMVSQNEVRWPYLGRISFKLDGLSTTGEVRVVSRRLAFGEAYQTPDAISLSVRRVSLQSTYRYVGYTGETRTKSAADGKQWAFVTVRAVNTAVKSRMVPLRFDFDIVIDGTRYEQVFTLKEDGQYRGGDAQPGETREGWILYSIPAAASVSDLDVVWREYYPPGDVEVVWVGAQG